MLEKGKDGRPIEDEEVGNRGAYGSGNRTAKNHKKVVYFSLSHVLFFIGCIFGSFIGTILVKILTQFL